MKAAFAKFKIYALWFFAIIGFIGIVIFLIFIKKKGSNSGAFINFVDNIQKYFGGVKAKANKISVKAAEEAAKADKVKEDINKVDGNVDNANEDDILKQVNDDENNQG